MTQITQSSYHSFSEAPPLPGIQAGMTVIFNVDSGDGDGEEQGDEGKGTGFW